LDIRCVSHRTDGVAGWDCVLFHEMNRWRKTMMGLPNWLRNREDDLDMTHDEVTVPPIAMIEKKPLPFHIAPVDEPSNHDQAAAVVAQAHAYIEQWKTERVAQQKLIDELQAELKSEQRKSGLLELDIAQHVNNIATLQSQVIALQQREEKYRQFLSVKKQINEKERQTYIQFEIDDPPKKERKPNAKTTKAERKAPDQAIEKIRPTPEASQ
jgi:hypothetical protein